MQEKRRPTALELDKILLKLAEYANCEETKLRILNIKPAATFEETGRLLCLTSDAHSLTNRFGTPSIYGVKPCSDAVSRAKAGSMLGMRELLDAAYIFKTARGLISWKQQDGGEETSLNPLFDCLDANKPLEDDITRSIISEEELDDHASPELYDIRRKIRGAHAKVREQLEKMTRSQSYQKYLQEQIVTIRNGRFVVPVKAEHKNEIKGLVHDTSASGATLFIEPMSVVEQNNLIRELESREVHEINRILLELSARVGESAELLLNDYDIIIELDVIFSKSKLADKLRATVPKLVENGETNLKKARHPLINADKIVPIDIFLGGGFDTLVITGPNTGGKTVALKTLGLLTLMAQCGLMIPAGDESTVCFYPKVLADIGDEQSIEQSLSTFSGHMTNIVSILEQAASDTLVLIDELGAGTDPVEGAALAVAIISKLRERGAKIAATTHYAEMKVYALQTKGVENASCEFDVKTLRPTYRLLIGVPGRSNAFAISERLGLPLDVIEAAKSQVSHENSRFEDVVSGLEEARQKLEDEKTLAEKNRMEAEIAKSGANELREKLESESEKEIQRARDRAKGIVEQVRFKSEQLLNELEDLKKQKDKADFSATVNDVKASFKMYLRELEEEADPVTQKKKEHYRLPRPLKRGDTVLLTDFGSEGTVLSPADTNGYVQVQAGIIKTKVKLTSLRLVDDSGRKTTLAGGAVNTKGAIKSAKETASSEVDLRGFDSAEAILELNRFIDNSVLSNLKTVTVIHGKGTGALRNAVQAHLRRHRAVKSYRTGQYGEGESGVTIAELK
ncbi:MAG: endonuclease MutS2 [Oscillospiraceae bacterium]|nr:endonuclease MutS2 [Oscillospiraceae bacterium]